MPRIPEALRNYARDAAGAFRLAPVEIVLGLVAALSFSVFLRREEMDGWARIAVPAALALPLVFGVSVLRARGVVDDAMRWGGTALVVVGAAAYGALVFDPELDREAWRFASLLGAAFLALSLVPAVGVSDPERRRAEFWRFNTLLLARIVGVVAYGLALFAALAGAVAAVSSLFELKTPEHLYQDLFGAVFFALVPWVVAGGIPELVAGPPGEGRAPRAVRLLGRYLYAPVLVVYLAILLAYAVKVVATGGMPKNLLSPIILLAGFFGFLGSLFLEPLRRDPEHTGVARLVRVFPALLLVLLPLAVRAVWVRMDEYGWTEFRYLRFALLLALAALAILGVVRLVRRREPLLLLVPVVLGATLLLSAVGPWGASAVSRRSQETRLREGLRQAGLLENGRYARPLPPPDSIDQPHGDTGRTIPQPLHGQITGAVTYLFESHGPESLRDVFPSGLSRYQDGWRLAAALPIRPGCAPGQEPQGIHLHLPGGAAVPGLVGGTLYRLERSGRRDAPEPGMGGVQLQLGETDVQVHSLAPERWTARVELGGVVERVAARGRGDCGSAARFGSDVLSPAEAVYPLMDQAGRARGQLVLTQLAAARRSPDPRTRAATGPFLLESVSGLVIVTE
ncbi:MAG TPA: DUF4153 domain-containing protein [Longimicrobiaceae bacterium]|nr:DUF4153 domain-containing protein [Longimicrobiaceae bacterium]